MPLDRPFIRFVGAGLVAGLLATACGNAAEEASETDAEVVAATGATGAGSSGTSAAGADGMSVPTGPSVAPLTGVPIAGEAGRTGLARPAVVVKIDNDPPARPQTGLNQADIVYEVEVEGITRFAAVFHSQDVPVVGPIRSARSSDPDLLGNLNQPLVAWSGANGTVYSEMAAAQWNGRLININRDDMDSLFWRDDSRVMPYNLYTNTANIWDQTPDDAGWPDQILGFREEGEAVVESAYPVAGAEVFFPSDGRIHSLEYAWDATSGTWKRFQGDFRFGSGSEAHRDSDGVVLAARNVVIAFINYTESAAGGGSPQALSVGVGDALVLTDGQAVEARWYRPTAEDAWELTTRDGKPVALTPGNTWFLLPPSGGAAFIDQARADSLLSQVAG